MTFNTILFVAATIVFVVALFIPVKEIDLVTLGLALFAAGHIPFASLVRSK